MSTKFILSLRGIWIGYCYLWCLTLDHMMMDYSLKSTNMLTFSIKECLKESRTSM